MKVEKGSNDTPNIRRAQFLLHHNVFKQNFRPGKIDGVFGDKTAAAVMNAKQALGYPMDGLNAVYGSKIHAFLTGDKPLPDDYKERRKKRRQPVPEFAPLSSLPSTFIEMPGNDQGTQPVFGITLHDTESHDLKGVSDMQGVAGFLDRTTDGLGAHYIVDKEGNIAECGKPTDLMFHAGRNTGYVGIEQIGFAKFPVNVWMVRQKQLASVARLCAWICQTYNVPAERDVDHGIHTHAMVARAYPDRTSHTDPGIGYPLGLQISRTKRILSRGGWKT